MRRARGRRRPRAGREAAGRHRGRGRRRSSTRPGGRRPRRRRPRRALQPRADGAAPRVPAGQLGEVFLIATERIGPFPDRVRDVGVVKDLATHDLDLVRWLGGAAVERVARRRPAPHGPRARGPRPRHRAPGQRRSASTAIVDWLSPTKVRRTRVLGERGMLVADTLTADLTFYENGDVTSEWASTQALRGVSEGDTTRYALARREPLLRRARGVLRPARAATPTPPVVTLAEGLETVVVRRGRARQRAARRDRCRRGGRVKAVVVALGKIGLPLAAQIARAGHEVVGCDIDPRVVDLVNAGAAAVPRRGRAWTRRWPRSSATGGCAPRPTPPRPSPRAPDLVVAVPPLVVDARRAARLAHPRRGRRRHRRRPAGRAPTVSRRDDAAGRHDARAHRARRSRPAQRPAGRGRLLRRLQPRARLQRPGLPRPRDLPQARRRPQRAPARRAASSSTAAFLDAPRSGRMGSAEAAELTKLAETTYRDVNIALRQRVRPLRRPRRPRRRPRDRRRQLAALQPHPPARRRGRRALHPGLPALLPRPATPEARLPARRARGQRGDARLRGRPARGRARRPRRRARADPRRRLPRRREGDGVQRRVRAARRARARAAPSRWPPTRSTTTTSCARSASSRGTARAVDGRDPAGRPRARTARWRRPTCPACARSSTAAACSTRARFAAAGVALRRIGGG